MSSEALAFGIYLGIGLVLMTVLLLAQVKERGVSGLDGVGGGGDFIDACLLILVAVLWPVWLIVWFVKKDRKAISMPQKKEPIQVPETTRGK
jgi:hypothetical protein